MKKIGIKKAVALMAAALVMSAPANAFAADNAPGPVQNAAQNAAVTEGAMPAGVSGAAAESPGAAGGADSRELAAVIDYAKSLFDIGDTYPDFNYSLTTNFGITQYNLSWAGKDGSSLNVGVTADERVVSYSVNAAVPYGQNQIKSFNSVTKEEAAAIARDFLKKVDPDNFGVYALGSVYFYAPQYSVSFYYTVNGVRVSDKIASVVLDPQTGAVQNYYNSAYGTAKGVYPKPDGIISRGRAVKAFSANADIQLNYTSQYSPGAQKSDIRLAYVCGGSAAVDAFTGGMLPPGSTGYGRYADLAGTAYKTAMNTTNALSPAEQKAVDRTAGMISADEAIKALNSALPGYADGLRQTGCSLYPYNDTASYMINFSDEKTGKSLYAGVDAYTGDILNFNLYDPDSFGAPTNVKPAEHTDIADALVKKLAPKHYAQLKLDRDGLNAQINAGGPYYGGTLSYNYYRLENGVPYKQNGVWVTLSDKTPASYSLTWDKGPFPAPSSAIAKDKAVSGLFDKLDFGLMYVPKSSADPRAAKDAMFQTEQQYVLAYQFDSDITLDAVTGELMNPPGQQPNAISYDDIKGSPMEDKIRQLADIGVGFPGKSLDAGAQVSKDEFLALIATCHYYSYTPLAAPDSGGSAAEPVQGLSSAEAVSLIIKDLGFDKITAKSFDIAGTYGNIGGVPAEYKNAVQLGGLFGLNIGGGSNFAVKDAITRGDAMELVYNLIKNYN